MKTSKSSVLDQLTCYETPLSLAEKKELECVIQTLLAEISPHEVDAIRSYCGSSEESLKEVAIRYDVTPATVRRWVNQSLTSMRQRMTAFVDSY